MRKFALGLTLMIITFSSSALGCPDYIEACNDDETQSDNAEKEIIEGPVSGNFYNDVHIVSDTVGVDAYGGVTVINSVIEADVCIRAPGQGLEIRNNTLKCNLCVEFTGRTIVDNTLSYNDCSGRMTNRPNAFR